MRNIVCYLALWCAVAGCGGDDPGEMVSRRSACEQANEAVCERLVECFPEEVYEDCVSVLGAEEGCDSREGECPASQLDACLEDVGALSCSDDADAPVTCTDNDC